MSARHQQPCSCSKESTPQPIAQICHDKYKHADVFQLPEYTFNNALRTSKERFLYVFENTCLFPWVTQLCWIVCSKPEYLPRKRNSGESYPMSSGSNTNIISFIIGWPGSCTNSFVFKKLLLYKESNRFFNPGKM
ncbi:hypothetical protein VP01_1283g4 [Puccinia sorghi]|uniref:Uncharacterized protein n=1 Tax=Puccinia sorghi TaxID=27349 RepID=A0A0L6VQ62_9BASI|nr:hypothetical protein VP01_1283g4 [Puccinia sorghi]